MFLFLFLLLFLCFCPIPSLNKFYLVPILEIKGIAHDVLDFWCFTKMNEYCQQLVSITDFQV